MKQKRIIYPVVFLQIIFTIIILTNTAYAAQLLADNKPINAVTPAETSHPHTSGLALVAHAGGAIGGYPDSNSLEAMQNSAKNGFRYIELDIITTSDNRLVLNHSWGHVSNRIPGIRDGVMTYDEFMRHRIFNQFTPVNLEMLIDFLRENPGPRIITDTKDTDYLALYVIAELFPEYMYRFIPQAYTFSSVSRIRALGFEDIILTIYMMNYTEQDPRAIHRFAVAENLYAVAFPESLLAPSFLGYLDMSEVRYMTHTINSVAKARELYEMGFYGIFTAFIKYTDDFSDITRVEMPVRGYMNTIHYNLQNLSSFQVNLMNQGMFYKINIPAYAHKGRVAPIWAEYLVSAPFAGPHNNLVYFVERHFERYTYHREWDSRIRALNIIYAGRPHTISGNNVNELVIYRDMIFISEEVVENIFCYVVLRNGDYVAVIPSDKIHYSDDFIKIAMLLFAGF